MASTSIPVGTGDVVFMLAVLAVPLWILFFGFIFKALKWF